MHLREIYTKAGEHATEHAHQISTRYCIKFSRYCTGCEYCPFDFRSKKEDFDNLSAVTPKPLIRSAPNFASTSE